MNPAASFNPGQKYSEGLVSLVRSLDCMEVCVRAANWHFSYEEEDPEHFNDGGGFHAWTWGTIQNLEATLPGFRAAFLAKVREETPGVEITTDALGDARLPELWQPYFEFARLPNLYIRSVLVDDPPVQLLVLPPEIMHVVSDKKRVIVFDDDVYIVPEGFSDDVIEVWFRRFFGWDDGGAYPMYLTKRPYGWQAYGIER